jgi:hypothetical protein
MKWKTENNTLWEVTKFNWKILETGKIYTLYTHIYITAHLPGIVTGLGLCYKPPLFVKWFGYVSVFYYNMLYTLALDSNLQPSLD